MKTRYFSLLDALRFLAAFWVMNFHYFLGSSGELSWHRYGDLGVQLFFIVSGFVIVQSLHGKTLKEFATGRFIRLFPLFWILCTITYLMTLIVPNANPLQFAEYLSSMTMLGDVFNGFVGYGVLIDPSYWTLGVELIFYAGVGIFVFLFSYKNIRYFLTSWLVFSMIALAYHVDHNFYIKLALVRHTSYFVFGGTLALIATRQAKNLYEKYFDRALLLVSAVYATYIYPSTLPPYPTPHPLDDSIKTILHIVFFISVPILVYLSSYIKSARTIRLLAILGGLTYPLYLLHQTIGNMIIEYVTNTLTIPWDSFVLVFEVFIIVIAYFVYLQDKKMRVWLLRQF